MDTHSHNDIDISYKAKLLLEPDVEVWKEWGLYCVILRHDEMLYLCGYVGLPPSHPLHGLHWREPAFPNFSVHGGVDWSDRFSRVDSVAGTSEDDIWWIGFSCCHYQDAAPGMDKFAQMIGYTQSAFNMGSVYRDWEYVKAHVRSLAEQLFNMAGGEHGDNNG